MGEKENQRRRERDSNLIGPAAPYSAHHTNPSRAAQSPCVCLRSPGATSWWVPQVRAGLLLPQLKQRPRWTGISTNRAILSLLAGLASTNPTGQLPLTPLLLARPWVCRWASVRARFYSRYELNRTVDSMGCSDLPP